MKKILNIISILCLSVLLFSCSAIYSGQSENNNYSDNKSLTVNMFVPDYSELAKNNARAVSPDTVKVRLYVMSNTRKWTYSSSNDIELASATKTAVSESPDNSFVPGYVYTFNFQNAIKEGIWKKGTIRVALLDSTNEILSEGFNSEDLDLTENETVTGTFYTEPYSMKNKNNVFKNSETATVIESNKMDFWYGYFVKDKTYTIVVTPEGSNFLDVAVFDEKGMFTEYKSITDNSESTITIKTSEDCGMYFGLYNKNPSSVSYTVKTTCSDEITSLQDANYDNLFADPSKWEIIDQSQNSRPEFEDSNTLYIPMSVTDSTYKTISYDFTVNKEMELVYDENTFVCPIYAGKMWIEVDGLGYTPSPNQIVENITKRIRVYPGKHTFKITGDDLSEGQRQYRHYVRNMQLVEIKNNNTLNEDWSSGKFDKALWGFRGREFPQIVNKIVEQQLDSESETEPKVIFPENADYGNFVKLVSKEISTNVQTNVNGSCSLILTNFTPSSKGKFVFDYFEDLGIKDIATFKITSPNSNGKEIELYATTFKNSYTPVQRSNYGVTEYKYDDKPRNWNTFSIELYAGIKYNFYWEIPKVSSTLGDDEFEYGLSKAFYIDNVKYISN